jgi:hypothetical protein
MIEMCVAKIGEGVEHSPNHALSSFKINVVSHCLESDPGRGREVGVDHGDTHIDDSLEEDVEKWIKVIRKSRCKHPGKKGSC